MRKLILLVSLLLCNFAAQPIRANHDQGEVIVESLSSNSLYQRWLEWEDSYNLVELEDKKNWRKPGNAAPFSWTHSPKVRSYGEMYSVTH